MASKSSNAKNKRLARSIKCRLDQLCCPYTENVEESWILELVFTPGESRILLLQWLFSKIDSRVNEILDPQRAPLDTKMDSRIQRLLFVASTLGLCHNDDADLIRGVKSGSKQTAFIGNLLDLVFVIDVAESSSSVLGNSSNFGSLEDHFFADCNLMNTLSTQTSVDALFPSDIRLLPPDIARQIEIDAQQKSTVDKNKVSPLPDVNKLTEEVNQLSKDLERQNEILSEITKKHKCSDIGGSTAAKSTLKQTMRLSFSELDQLVTSFTYCFDNEMRSWCGGSTGNEANSTSSASLGPTLKRINGPLEQFCNLLSDVQSCRATYRKLCSELHRDIGRLRKDAERLASSRLNQGDSQLLCSTLTEAVDVLERSVQRIESSAASSMSTSQLHHLRRQVSAAGGSMTPSTSLNSSSVVSASIKLH